MDWGGLGESSAEVIFSLHSVWGGDKALWEIWIFVGGEQVRGVKSWCFEAILPPNLSSHDSHLTHRPSIQNLLLLSHSPRLPPPADWHGHPRVIFSWANILLPHEKSCVQPIEIFTVGEAVRSTCGAYNLLAGRNRLRQVYPFKGLILPPTKRSRCSLAAVPFTVVFPLTAIVPLTAVVPLAAVVPLGIVFVSA